MADVFLGLGSNLGDRAGYLRDAIGAIHALSDTRVIDASPIYETPPMGPKDQDAYLNMAARIETGLEPAELISALQAIETRLGRAGHDQRQHWGPREIDIDVLLYSARIIAAPGIAIPHPGMHERWFVLRPLADIAPEAVHPKLGKAVSDLLDAVAMPAGVQEFVA